MITISYLVFGTSLSPSRSFAHLLDIRLLYTPKFSHRFFSAFSSNFILFHNEYRLLMRNILKIRSLIPRTAINSCEKYEDECTTLHCPYGVHRNYDRDGCERCQCVDPCRDHRCPAQSQCSVDLTSDQQHGTAFIAVCRPGATCDDNNGLGQSE